MPAPHIDTSLAVRSALTGAAGLFAWSALLGIGAAVGAWAGRPDLASAAGPLLAALASAPLALSGIRRRGGLPSTATMVLAALFGAVLQVVLALASAPFADAAGPVAPATSAVFALSAALFAPTGEEVCFRLVLLRSLRSASHALGLNDRASTFLAVAVQAAAFAYMHPAASFVQTLVLGIVCGVAAARHGIAASIALHMGFNAAAIALMAL